MCQQWVAHEHFDLYASLTNDYAGTQLFLFFFLQMIMLTEMIAKCSYPYETIFSVKIYSFISVATKI